MSQNLFLLLKTYNSSSSPFVRCLQQHDISLSCRKLLACICTATGKTFLGDNIFSFIKELKIMVIRE